MLKKVFGVVLLLVVVGVGYFALQAMGKAKPMSSAAAQTATTTADDAHSLIAPANDRDQAIEKMIRDTIAHPKGQVITDNIAADKVAGYVSEIYKKVRTDDYGKYSMVCRDGYKLNYRLYKPAAVAKQKYPLVIFFHRSGSIGSDNTSQMNSTAPLLWSIPEIQTKYPCYVVVPQLSAELKNQNTAIVQGVRAWAPMANVEHQELNQKLLHDYPNIDAKRVYLVGHSMGAGQVYSSISLDPDFYAAALACDVPGNPGKTAPIIVEHHVKLMIFCGGTNDGVPPSTGLTMAENMNKLGGQVTVVHFLNFDHGMMGDMFTSEPGVVDWLFAQHR